LELFDVAVHKHYANAPIREALIDIRVELLPDIKLSSLDEAYELIRVDYPTRNEMKFVQSEISLVGQGSASTKQEIIGYRFSAQDGKQIVQTRLDGFTFSRLTPYECWEALRDEAKKLWSIYQGVARPQKITRIAVRYINQIDIPLPMRDFKDFFRTFPDVSEDLPQEIGGFLMQLQIPQKDFDGMLVLTEALVPPAKRDVASVVLDIDVFKMKYDFGSDEAWNFLEVLRERKNEIFEGCITDKARDLFGPLIK